MGFSEGPQEVRAQELDLPPQRLPLVVAPAQACLHAASFRRARLDIRVSVRESAARMVQRPPILIVREPVPRSRVEEYARAWFGDMVKIVADVKRTVLSLGGELHADGEKLLLAEGSLQDDLWGANVYPFRPEASRLEFTALINIRPRQSNRTMEVQDPQVRQAIRGVVELLLPAGGAP